MSDSPEQDRRSWLPARIGGGGRGAPPPPPPTDDEEGMLRMSFLEHLEELRKRLIWAISGAGIIFLACIALGPWLWEIISAPATDALQKIGFALKDAQLVATEPMEGFNIMWFKVPAVTALFLSSPWVLYQIWAFIAPGLYKKERRYAVPFVACTAGLFILGGLFAYFVAFRFGLTFLLKLMVMGGVRPMVTITSYFDLFVNVMLGVALIFELPMVIFFLVLLRIVKISWLMANSRYAILGITILAAIVTPTPDALNMTMVALPMILLYFVGVFAGYLLELKRAGRKFPWAKVSLWTGIALAAIAGAVFFAIRHYHLHWIRHWPFLGH